MSTGDSMQTIDRAMAILKSFSAREPELSLADLHHKLGLSKSSLQRVLNSLVFQGLLEKDNNRKTYQLGLEIYFLGQLVERNSQLLSKSNRHMINLRDQLGEAVGLNILYKERRKCIGYIPGKHELATITYVGQTSPLYAGSSAKLLMAFLPVEEQEKLLQKIEFEKMAENTILNKEDLLKELQKVQKNGYATSRSERVKGAFSLCAPIKNRFGEVIAGVTLLIPTARVDETKMDYYIEETLKTASAISSDLS